MYFIVSIILIALLIVTILLVDKIVTIKRLEENQIAWDEYSKDMTFDEKNQCYLEWCERRKAEKHWEHYYFPRMQ